MIYSQRTPFLPQTRSPKFSILVNHRIFTSKRESFQSSAFPHNRSHKLHHLHKFPKKESSKMYPYSNNKDSHRIRLLHHCHRQPVDLQCKRIVHLPRIGSLHASSILRRRLSDHVAYQCGRRAQAFGRELGQGGKQSEYFLRLPICHMGLTFGPLM